MTIHLKGVVSMPTVLASSSTTSTSDLLTLPSLPKLTVQARGGEPQFDAYVNAYVIGQQPAILPGGHRATPLYYLSLVAQRGQGTTVQGVFARLVSVHSRDVSLSGVGVVTLARNVEPLSTCGYSLHWNFEQAEILPTHDLHAVIESHQLTICDPVRAMAVRPRRRRSTPKGTASSSKAQKGQVSLTTAKKSGAKLTVEEMRHRELRPLFVLLVPGSKKGQSTFLHQLHLAFLDPRVPWPLDPAWAEFLWWRGLRRGEIEPLTVWCAPAPTKEEEQDADVRYQLPLAEAYLCHPNPVLLQRDLQAALSQRRLPLP